MLPHHPKNEIHDETRSPLPAQSPEAALPGRDRLRVAVGGRLDAMLAPGGGEVQMHCTVKGLRRLGVDARPWRPWEESLEPCEVLHLFGSVREWLPLARRAKALGVPVVVSTIAWFSLTGYWRSGSSLPGRLAAAGKFLLRAGWSGWPSWRRELYHTADLLLPNSQAEAEQLVRYFGVSHEKIHVVPNGADSGLAQADPRPFAELVGCRGFVLCAGRIEPRKNQLGLLRALRGSGATVVILGDPVPGYEDYFAACRRAADRHVRFVSRLEHDDPLLASAYAAAGCVALCSWFETPGLVALEAGMQGVPLVLTSGGCTREYFGPDAFYANPHRADEIRAAVRSALASGRNLGLAHRLRNHFSWEVVAQVTEEAYRKVM